MPHGGIVGLTSRVGWVRAGLGESSAVWELKNHMAEILPSRRMVRAETLPGGVSVLMEQGARAWGRPPAGGER